MNHTLLVSPSEPKSLKTMLNAITHELCEDNGADILTYIKKQRVYSVGWQRKTINDLIASMEDGRLAFECQKLTKLTFPILIIEGEFSYSKDGVLFREDGKPTKYTKTSIRNLKRSLKYVLNIQIEESDTLIETVEIINEVVEWLEEETHISLFRRPPYKSEWGVPSIDELQLWFLQGLPTIGVTRSQNIINRFGYLPINWSCTKAELKSVRGIGKKGVNELYEFLNKE